jgi:hypothetical protein
MTQVRKPRNIDYEQSSRLQSRLISIGIRPPEGWEVFVVDAPRGQARANSKTCTVPKWATIHDNYKNISPDFELYYAAHEIAHAYNFEVNGNCADHDAAFYGFFKEHCPAYLWHHELNYRKREPKKAGISDIPEENIAQGNDAPDDVHVAIAAGPTEDLTQLRAEAIKTDPKLKKYLPNVEDRELKSYLRGYFQHSI